MKTSQFICLVAGLFIFFQANSQNPVSYPKSSEKEVDNIQNITDVKPDSSLVSVNLEMIRRFRECKPDTTFITFGDILKKYDFSTIREAYVAYYNSYFQQPLNVDRKLAQKP